MSKPTEQRYWLSPPPTKCDICQRPIYLTFIDGRTNKSLSGCWAIMCPTCHEFHGVGLGTGFGQQYLYSRTQDKYMKVAG